MNAPKGNKKIKLLDDLTLLVERLRRAGKVVVQSHGVFDLIHPGVLHHLNDAKAQGDVLIVTVIKDKDVRKGPGRPIFGEDLRLRSISQMEQVDYVCLVDDEVPFECIRKIKPDIFAKGQAYKERDREIHEKIFKEEKEFYFEKTKVSETKGFSFSSSQIINNFLDIYPEATKKFLREFSSRHTFSSIVKTLNALKDLKVLIIGDGIIDEYHYCETMGKSPKAQLIVNKYLNHEVFAGGVFAIANHVAGLCNDVQLISLLGKDDSREAFIIEKLKPNIKTTFFYRDNGPTVIKKRYINAYQKQKLFEVNFINDCSIDKDCESGIIGYLKTVIDQYDLVMVSDFGHGLITKRLIRTIEGLSKRLAVNTQTNGANAGYNLITKYGKACFICLDTAEARLASQEKYADIDEVGEKLFRTINTDYLMITLGNTGSICFSRGSEKNLTPAFATKVIDIIGAGDAFFAYTAPCFAVGLPTELVSFIGNAVGALAVQIVGNKKTVEKYELLEFIHTLLK